jgi:hypothetical protein
MKIRALIAHGAAIGALAVSGLTLTTGTAQAAVNCNYLRNQLSVWRNTFYTDVAAQEYYLDLGDWDQAAFYGDLIADDQATISNYQSRLRMAHCA